MTIINKEVLQSYIITTAKYDFSIYEKRILYRQVEIEQELLLEQKIQPGVIIETSIFKDKQYTIPVKWLLSGEDDKNHVRVRKAFKSLMSKIIEYETPTTIEGFPLIQRFKIDKRGETVTWQVPMEIVDVIVNFAKGFRKYELKTAMEFNSIYAMRFYELLSGQEKPITFTIDNLKAMFKIVGKYKLTADFIRYVIEPAKKELDEKSPYSFEYKVNKQGKKFHSITFYPVHQPQHSDENIERQKLNNQLSLGWDLNRETIQYLKEIYLFDNKEINQHRELLKIAEKELDILVILAKTKRYAEAARNPKGYVIQVLKKEMYKLEEKKKVTGQKTQTLSEPTERVLQNSMDMITSLAKKYSQNK